MKERSELRLKQYSAQRVIRLAMLICVPSKVELVVGNRVKWSWVSFSLLDFDHCGHS